MTVSADMWQACAAMCELLALSFRYPDSTVLAEAVVSGEWAEAAEEIANVLGISWKYNATPDALGINENTGVDDFQKRLRPEATRLFVGVPKAVCAPYEGIWRAGAEGAEALMFVNTHARAVDGFCKACGLGHPEGTNEPLDALWTELELLAHLALRAAEEESLAATPASSSASASASEEAASGFIAAADLPGGSPEAAYNEFMNSHAQKWMPQFAEALQQEARVPFYRAAASLLAAFMK